MKIKTNTFKKLDKYFLTIAQIYFLTLILFILDMFLLEHMFYEAIHSLIIKTFNDYLLTQRIMDLILLAGPIFLILTIIYLITKLLYKKKIKQNFKTVNYALIIFFITSLIGISIIILLAGLSA